jgi:Zn-finger nucleic acid-binding protein
MIFAGSKFCPHCGAKTENPEPVNESAIKSCPRCKVPLNPVVLGATRLEECGKCNGMWVNVETLETICTNSEKLAAVDTAVAAEVRPAQFEPEIDNIRYVPCPVCTKLMNRLNFGGISGVVVDVCRGHGTWFDPGELQHVVEFIRSGGMDAARRREQEKEAELARIRKAVPPVPVDIPAYGRSWSPGNDYSGLIDLLATAAYVLLRFIRW